MELGHHQRHAVVARLVQQGCSQEKERLRPGGPREGAQLSRPMPPPDDQRAGPQRPRTSPPRLRRQARPRAASPGAGLGTGWEPAATSPQRAGRGPLCPAGADALDANSAVPPGASASSGARARRPEPVMVAARECRRSAVPERRQSRSRLARRRGRPPVGPAATPTPRARLRHTPDRQAWVQRVPRPPLVAAGFVSAGTGMAEHGHTRPETTIIYAPPELAKHRTVLERLRRQDETAAPFPVSG